MLPFFIEAPVASFRPKWARDFQETYPAPPPATLMGLFLSALGVAWEDKGEYDGLVEMAVAMDERSYFDGALQKAKVLRSLRRVPQNNPLSERETMVARRPDYQEILLDVRVWVWLRPCDVPGGEVGGAEERRDSHAFLRDVAKAIKRGNGVSRHGALSLGDSTHLVNQIKQQSPCGRRGRFVRVDEAGFLSMPVWVDHKVGEAGFSESRLVKFCIGETEALEDEVGDADCWVRVGR